MITLDNDEFEQIVYINGTISTDNTSINGWKIDTNWTKGTGWQLENPEYKNLLLVADIPMR